MGEKKGDIPARLKTPPGTGSFLRSPRSPGAPGCLSPSRRWGFQQSRTFYFFTQPECARVPPK